MLILTRRRDQSFIIDLATTTHPDLTAAELFLAGPVKVTVLTEGFGGIRLGIQAPAELKILRSELREI